MFVGVCWMSRAGGRDVAVAKRDCRISMTSQTRPIVNIASVRSRSIKRRQWKHKMDYYGVVFAHLATGRWINAKDPSGLDSDRWIPHSRCCENPARAKALAGFSRHLSAGFTDLNPALGSFAIFHAPTRTTSSGCLVLHRIDQSHQRLDQPITDLNRNILRGHQRT